MARIAGRRGQLYVGIASDTAAASPVPYLSQYTFESTSDQIEVTAFGDTTKTYVLGLPDAKGTYTGFYDTATAQLYTAATDGLARRTYLYPDTNATGTYWFGTAFHDFSLDVSVSGPVGISGNFVAATAFQKVG